MCCLIAPTAALLLIADRVLITSLTCLLRFFYFIYLFVCLFVLFLLIFTRHVGRSRCTVVFNLNISLTLFLWHVRLHNGDNAEIKKYFVSFWNGVDLRYKLLKGPKVRISIAGIIISRVSCSYFLLYLIDSWFRVVEDFFFKIRSYNMHSCLGRWTFLNSTFTFFNRAETRLPTSKRIALGATPSTRQPLWLIWESTCSKRGACLSTILPLPSPSKLVNLLRICSLDALNYSISNGN